MLVLKGIAWGLLGSKKVNAVNYVGARDENAEDVYFAERRMTLSLIKNKTQDHKQR